MGVSGECQVKEAHLGLESQSTCAWNLKQVRFTLSEPQFPYLQNGDG